MYAPYFQPLVGGRFERLARGLMAVSKKELDKELAKEEREKERTKNTKKE
jgi:hypothetical protein